MTQVRFTGIGCLFLSCLFPILFGACTSPGPSPMTFSMRQLREVDPGATFQAADDALAELGYRVDRRDPPAGVLTTFPVKGTVQDEAAARRGRLGTPRPTRRVAQVRIEGRTGEVAVYCKVAVQEQTTEAYRLREYDLRTSDSPAETPIEREAATTKAQNTVWRTVRRDKAEERRILTAIIERAGGATPPPDTGGTP
jgi:hypothetical protein